MRNTFYKHAAFVMVFAKRAKTHAKSYLWGCCHTTGFTRGYACLIRQPADQ